jgi:succinate dehydrogenase / fumarate reductase cytochrome b subunit
MKQKIRPLSPHLTVYKPQLTSVLSIFHRITGSILVLSMTLSLILFYFSFSFLGFSYQYCFFFDFFSLFSPFIIVVSYFVLFGISFHIINGIRHLSWDLALGLEIKSLYVTGGIVLCLVLVIIVISILV